MRAFLLLGAFALSGCATTRPVSEVGIAFTAAGEVATFADGLADPKAGRAITPNDPARIASISKLVVAIGVMKLVEQGALDLDEDVSRYLDWPLRSPAFLDQPITLRMLLSHTSSIRDHDDQYAIPLGETVKDAMAASTSWDPAHSPGEHYFAYSNMNFPIIAGIVEKVTRERFDLWMRRQVLDPMSIDACFNWPTCSDAAIARAVVLTRDGEVIRDDLKGKRPDCPVFVRDGVACDITGAWRPGVNGALFSPQGGLRISVRGLSRVGRMLLGRGTLDGKRILSPQSVDTILTQAWRYDGRNGDAQKFYCSYGLATQLFPSGNAACKDDPGTRGMTFIGHAGEAYGLRSGLWIDPRSGRGIAYFLTGQPDSTPEDASSSAAEAAAFRRALALLPR